MNRPWRGGWRRRAGGGSGRWRRRRERGLAILPSLLTLGNAVCGFGAIIKVATVQWAAGAAEVATHFHEAAILILVAMVFDMLDGRVARLTRQTSDFGGQLDSLSDAITFGLAPGILVAVANSRDHFPEHPFWAKAAWVFGAAYSCGAILRLARFNVENEHDEEAHMQFKGLPSPAAAGVVATLVLLQGFLTTDRAERSIGWVEPGLLPTIASSMTFALPLVALVLGYLMISQHRYVHVANRFLRGRKPFDMLALIVFSIVLFALVPEVLGAVGFAVFALSGPLGTLRRRGFEVPQPATQPSPQTQTPPPAPDRDRLDGGAAPAPPAG